MSARKADKVIDQALHEDGKTEEVLEYLLQLERQKHALMLKNGCLDFEALRARLRALEVDIAGLSTTFASAPEPNGHTQGPDVTSTPVKSQNREAEEELDATPTSSNLQPSSAEMEDLELSMQSIDVRPGEESEHDVSVRRSSLQSTGSAKDRHMSHSKQHRRLSIGSHPLYTMPNAFQYGIKLRDTKMNGMSMYEETGTKELADTASPTDQRVQGSRERETNIRSITDKFVDSINGTDKATAELRRAMNNSNEHPTNRASFSMSATLAGEKKVRTTSSEAAPGAGSTLAKVLLSGGGHGSLAEEFDGDLTMDSIDAPKRHSMVELAEVIESGGAQDETLSAASDISSAPDGAIEFCIVEADWSQLHQQSQRGHLLTPLLPPRRSWRYPMDLEDNAENNTKELQDQSFFFPSGVKVDLVLPSVAALRSKQNKHIRHIVPFTDAQGKPTYACVLTVTQTYNVSEIAQLGDLILPNLVNINRQKQSASCIQKCFRQYVAYKKMVTWQHKAVNISKPVAASSPSLQRSTTIFGRIAVGAASGKDILPESSAHGSTGTGSTVDEKSGPSRRTWSSFFSSTRSHVVESIDSSMHGIRSSTAAAPGSAGAPAGADGSRRPSSLVGRSASITGATSAASTPTQAGASAAAASRRRTADVPAATTLAATAAEQAQAEARRRQQEQESQAEYLRRRVAVAQKAYCIISTSREYTFIFQVLDAIAAAEGFTDARKQASAPFGSTLSTDDDESDDGLPDGRSSTCSGSDFMYSVSAHGSSPIGAVPGLAAQPAFTTVSSSDHPLSQRGRADSPLSQGALSSPNGLSSPNALYAAMDAYYNEFRLKRDAQRNEFLQEVEAFLLDHLTTPAPSAIQQIKTEFAFSPGAAVAAQSAKLKTNRNTPGSHGISNALNSPILGLRNKSQTAGNSSSKLAPAGTRAGNSNPGLNKAALAHIAALGKAKSQAAESGEVDLNNRFAHYSEIGAPTLHHIRIPGYIEDFRIDLKALLTTKEWSCAVLLTHLSSTIIFKIINLLLMEKSLIIHGKNAGIVTTITMAVINLVSPFLWEGIFVPLVPDNARELFGAPVPLIVGTISAPRVNDVSSDTAILFLNDDNVTITSYPEVPDGARVEPRHKSTLKFVAWFVRLPEVSADLPVEFEMCRRLDHTSSLLCDFVKNKIEYKDEVTSSSSSSSMRYSTSVPATPLTAQTALSQAPIDKVCKITNTIDSLLMSAVPLHILHNVRVLIVAIKRFNYGFCGCVISDPGSWKRFLRHSNRTGEDEFYPEYFMEPLRNHLEFQDAIVHTQLFVSFMDKLRKEQHLLDTLRRFLAEWIYFRAYLHKKRQYLKQLNTLLDR